jgi:hypothetical protein
MLTSLPVVLTVQPPAPTLVSVALASFVVVVEAAEALADGSMPVVTVEVTVPEVVTAGVLAPLVIVEPVPVAGGASGGATCTTGKVEPVPVRLSW